MEREATSVRAAQEMIQMAELWGMGRGVINLVLVNRTSLATGLSQDEIAQTLGCQVVGMIPNAGEALMSSTRQGEILIRSNQQTPAANSYRQLANLIRNINQDTSVLYRG
jgi:septum formation inhibitor-activating ATPase MinD